MIPFHCKCGTTNPDEYQTLIVKGKEYKVKSVCKLCKSRYDRQTRRYKKAQEKLSKYPQDKNAFKWRQVLPPDSTENAYYPRIPEPKSKGGK